MDGHPLILLKHGGPSRKKASLYGKVAQIYFALSGSFLLCAQQRDGGQDGTDRAVTAQRSLTLRPAGSPRHLVSLYTEGFSHFVTSMTAPIATGRSECCRVGFAPTGKAPPLHGARRTQV